MTKTPSIHKWHPSPLSPMMQQAFIQVSQDIKLCVEVGGNPNNPPLLLIMGLGSQLIFWPENLIKRLIDAGFYVIRFDNRDIGLSTKIQSNNKSHVNLLGAMLKMQFGINNSNTPVAYHLTDMADDVAGLMQALGLEQTHILGASMGGMIAQIFAAKYPHLINKLALIFSTNNRPLLQPPHPKQLYTLFKRPASHQEQDVVSHGQWFIKTVGSPGYIDQEMVTALSHLRYQRCFYPAGTLQQLAAILTTGSIKAYSQAISAPTLIMHGSKDGLLPPSHGRAVANDIPQAKFTLIKGMAHDLPEYFQPFIVQQLKQHMLNSVA